MKPEYQEGLKALENFERMATAVFKAPKADGRNKPKKPTKAIKKSADKD
jgi:hypothetical protein